MIIIAIYTKPFLLAHGTFEDGCQWGDGKT
jgi:hypothetical protein